MTDIHDQLLLLSNGTPIVDVSVRLVGGHTSMQGRVEVYYSGRWLSVCSTLLYSFGSEEAATICRQLGYSYVMSTTTRHWRPTTTAFVYCSGVRSTLDQCSITMAPCSTIYRQYVECSSE